MEPMALQPIILQGANARLEPLQIQHATDLLLAGKNAAIWTYLPISQPETLAAVTQWIEQALAAQERKEELPFTIISQLTGKIVGTTRLMNISHENRGLEIGWTWLSPAVWSSAINTECKYLLLRHAFEELQTIRVQFKTDSRNIRSQRAIERLGATKEGTLRNHVIMPDGYYRHSIYYSIIDTEWPHVKQNLEAKMRAYQAKNTLA